LAEDDNGETKARLEAICSALNVSLSKLPIHFWCLPGHDVTLAAVADNGSWTPGPFWEPLRARLREIGPCFLGLDTVSDVALLDETKRLPVNTLCKQVFAGLCREFDVTILANAHPSKASMNDGTGYSGSTAWNNAVRNRLTFEREKEGGPARLLKVAKYNYGPEPELRLYLNGRTFATAAEAGRTPQQERAGVLEAALRILDNGTAIVRGNGSGQKPKDVAEVVVENSGFRLTSAQVLAHLNALEREGVLQYRDSDKNKHSKAGFRRGPKCPP
jgi:RecA-family ATPase